MLLIKILVLLLLLKTAGFIVIRILKRHPEKKPLQRQKTSSVDIIVPMYNEEKVILKTINNLLEINYSGVRLIVIDDGSTDRSLEIVSKNFSSNPAVRILHTKNQGKAHALNDAMRVATSEIVFCIDADTMVLPNIVNAILPYFEDPEVVAVAGSIKVGNSDNLITRMQYFEYMTTQNYERAVFEKINGIMVVPGAIGAFRRSAISKLGGYTSDTLTEDTEITLKILCQNYRIMNAPEAVAYTEAPASTEMFLKQRVRWKIGTIQVLIKYARQSFLHDSKAISLLVVPYTWMFSILIPLVAPIADYLVLVSVLRHFTAGLLYWYLSYLFIDGLICTAILRDIREDGNFFRSVMMRFILRQLTFFSYVMIAVRFFKGTANEWGKVARYGNVNINPAGHREKIISPAPVIKRANLPV
jgi:cellulose synthase/poly-beta-1,6-N-acetylglucosamine synthase-like glycosyltransferase